MKKVVNQIAQQNTNSSNSVGKQNELKHLPKHESSAFSGLGLFDEGQLVAAENFLTKIMRSDKGGIKSVNDGLAILMRAQDLNLLFSTCIEHIHVINEKTGVDIHIVKALLSRAGCTWRCVKDYQPHEYTDGINVYVDGSFPKYVIRCNNQKAADKTHEHMYVYPVKWYKDIKGNVYKDYQLNTKQLGIAVNRTQITEITNSGSIAVYRVPDVPVDYVTEYVLTQNINSKEITSVGRFSYTEVTAAGLFEKDT